ncbi:MAG TPA: recombinase family protein [Burkholderiales bacterium]
MKDRCAALYLRSSKDRKDVSIEAQRRQLQQLATERGLLIVQEFADTVESGKDDQRPGFQRMLADLRRPERTWSTLLLLDTSRLARRRLTSIMFEELDAKRYGITIVYKNLPDLEAAESMLLRNQLQGLDEYHSLISKRKGLSGMATNIENGYRAGGRAPRGYRLRHIGTGTVREGQEVLKSVLETSADAPLVARYLKARAAGRSRLALRAELNLTWASSSMVGMEWNALTYAGHTVWNVHNEFERGRGYKNHSKRRPPAEWVIKRDTHPALITDDEAQVLLAQLAQSRHGPKTRRTSAAYLLTGLLRTPSGERWHGNGAGRYRLKTNRVNICQSDIETNVVRQVLDDMESADFARRLATEAKRYVARHRTDPAGDLRAQIADVTGKISRMMDFAGRMADPDPALREIEALERERKELAEELSRRDREHSAAAGLRNITESRMRDLLRTTVQQMKTINREAMKDALSAMIDQITLDPETLDCRIHYRIEVRDNLASPRPCAAIPILRLVSRIKVA